MLCSVINDNHPDIKIIFRIGIRSDLSCGLESIQGGASEKIKHALL